jgi:membrane protease YdiL (CAAX protease family)
VSAPENPIHEPQATPDPPFQPVLPVIAPHPPPAENPAWTIWDVVGIACITFFAIIACVLATSVFVHLRFASGAPWMESIKRPEVIVGGQLLAYALVVFLMYRLLATSSSGNVLDTICWNWPPNWMVYLLGGVALSLFLLPLGNLLPMPKNVPLDDFFRTARDAYILSLFGILFAPLFEELFFRGFLYPVVEAWLHGVLHSPYRLRRGRSLLLMTAVWGYALQSFPEKTRVYPAILLSAATLGFLFARMIAPEGRIPGRWALPMACFSAWSFVAYALHGAGLFEATLFPVLLALFLEAQARRTPAPDAPILAMAGGIILTACAFASIHASQLKYSWGPVLIIFLVGIALTSVRALKKSVAATVLMHMAYNSTIFVATYIATDRFQHMEKFNR